jgi:hypothetical protein
MSGISADETESKASVACLELVEAVAQWPEKTLERGEGD